MVRRRGSRVACGIILGLTAALAVVLHTGDRPVAAARQSDAAADTLTNTIYLPTLTNWHVTVHPWETEVIALTNAERANHGCAPLAYNPRLTAAAQGHSRDMAINDYFSHYSLDGRTPWDRIRATGYDYDRAAENIAAGYGSPASVVAGWMTSSGHRANILNCALTEIGVGYHYLSPDTGSVNYSRYWTQVFATPDS